MKKKTLNVQHMFLFFFSFFAHEKKVPKVVNYGFKCGHTERQCFRIWEIYCKTCFTSVFDCFKKWIFQKKKKTCVWSRIVTFSTLSKSLNSQIFTFNYKNVQYTLLIAWMWFWKSFEVTCKSIELFRPEIIKTPIQCNYR